MSVEVHGYTFATEGEAIASGLFAIARAIDGLKCAVADTTASTGVVTLADACNGIAIEIANRR